MQNSILKPKTREGAGLWMIKIFGGAVIVIVLTVHFIVNHLVAPGGLLSYADVIRYFQSPIVIVMEITFLVVAVVHSLLGVRSILLDLNPSDRVLKGIDIAALMVGTIAIVYGVWLAFFLAGKGGVV